MLSRENGEEQLHETDILLLITSFQNCFKEPNCNVVQTLNLFASTMCPAFVSISCVQNLKQNLR